MTVTTAPMPSPYAASDLAPFAVVWTRDDCERLEELGFLDYRYELINGVIIRKMPQNKRHAYCVTRALKWAMNRFDTDCLQSQSSLRVAAEDNRVNKPEPDVALLNKPLLDVTGDQPAPEDIRLAIEVADTTKNMDLGTKAQLYARAGVPEYWVISVDERKVYIHRNPRPNGEYDRTEATDTDTIAPAFAPDATIAVADLLPPT